jgi:hypothetical protein
VSEWAAVRVGLGSRRQQCFVGCAFCGESVALHGQVVAYGALGIGFFFFFFFFLILLLLLSQDSRLWEELAMVAALPQPFQAFQTVTEVGFGVWTFWRVGPEGEVVRGRRDGDAPRKTAREVACSLGGRRGRSLEVERQALSEQRTEFPLSIRGVRESENLHRQSSWMGRGILQEPQSPVPYPCATADYRSHLPRSREVVSG